MADYEKKELKKKSQDISGWYTNVIQRAEISEYGPVRGTMVIRPYGYAIWERVQEIFNKMMEEDGVSNAYFPMLIPYSLLKKEKDHVEGFSPELALVTKAGGEDLEDPLVIRPTSETIMYEMYSKWINSWRDLPIKINQWNNVVRWEKRTLMFLRTSEFLWQEGHCAHATSKESRDMVLRALGWYEKIFEEYYAIPVVSGKKSEAEKFAGADATYGVEVLMPGGKALQGATSHDLGQNFSKVQNISFQDKNGETQYVWQNSWGLSTRSLGALFMVHGDDDGLVLPPKVAPIKLAIIPIFGKKDDAVLKYCEKIKKTVEDFESEFPGKVIIMHDSESSFGRRVNEVEIKGIPLKIAVGTREVEESAVTISCRIDGVSEMLSRVDDVSKRVEKKLNKMQKKMYENAKVFLKENTTKANNYDEFRETMKGKKGFIKAYWCGSEDCEVKIKEETKATTRVKVAGEKKEKGKCVYCSKDSSNLWYFAQAY
jgi:prolyl-tRNA synthetase